MPRSLAVLVCLALGGLGGGCDPSRVSDPLDAFRIDAGPSGGDDAPSLDAPGLDALGLDAPGADVPGLDAPALDAPALDAAEPPDGGASDAAIAVDGGPPVVADAGPARVERGGDVSGSWCGAVDVTGTVTVPVGSTLTVCAGSILRFATRAGMTVGGTLVLAGTAARRITMTASGTRWPGIDASGTVSGDFTDVSAAVTGVLGRTASVVRLDDSSIATSTTTVTLANGGTFDRTRLIGGGAITITGGVLRMTDSVIDQLHPIDAPDCTIWGGGGAVLDHVRLTGCHCPLHINRTTLPLTVTNSILDGATNPVMISNTTATFHGNHFDGVGVLMLDIGDGNGIVADVADNYWLGSAPDIATARPDQFRGTAMYSTTPLAGVGPR